MVELGANLNQLGMQTFPLASCQAKANIKSDPKSIEWIIQNDLQGGKNLNILRYFLSQSQKKYEKFTMEFFSNCIDANEGF